MPTYERIVYEGEETSLVNVDFSDKTVKHSDEQELTADIDEAGVYVFQAKTEDFAPAGGKLVRFVRIHLTLQVPEREDDVIVLEDQLSSMYNKVALRFHVLSTAKLQVHMTTRARFKSIKLQCRVIRKASLEPSLSWIQAGGMDDENASAIEKRTFAMSELPSYKRERVYIASDEWPDRALYSFTNLPTANYRKILERDSEYKQKAFEAGLIRPFLMLATMHPVDRLRWAKALKVPILDLRRYGDEHLEAYWILDFDRKGLQARANHALRQSVNPLGKDCNWCQILYRVCHRALTSSKKVTEETKEAMKAQKALNKHSASIAACLDPENLDDVKLENTFMKGLSQAVMTALETSEPEEFCRMQVAMDSTQYNEVAKKLMANGYDDETTVKCFCWLAENGGAAYFFKVIERWAERVREGTLRHKLRIAIPVGTITASMGLFLLTSLVPIFVVVPITLLGIGTASFIWRETPGKLLLPLVGMACQRFRLACADLNMADFYPAPAPQ